MKFQSSLRLLLTTSLILSFAVTSVPAAEEQPVSQAGESAPVKKVPVWSVTVNPSESIDAKFTGELFQVLQIAEEFEQALQGAKFSFFGFSEGEGWVVSIRDLKDAKKLCAAAEGDDLHIKVLKGSELLISPEPLGGDLGLSFDDEVLFSFELDLNSLDQERLDSALLKRFHRVKLAMHEEADSGGLSIVLFAESPVEFPEGKQMESAFRRLGQELGDKTGLPLQNLTLEVKAKTIKFTASLDKGGRREIFSLLAALFSSAMEKAEDPSK